MANILSKIISKTALTGKIYDLRSNFHSPKQINNFFEKKFCYCVFSFLSSPGF